MPKQKTSKSAAKRFKKTSGGKITYAKAGTGHLMAHKSRKRKRSLRKRGVLDPIERKRVSELLPN